MPIGYYKRSKEQLEKLAEYARRPRPNCRTLKDLECPVCHKIFRPKYHLIKHCSKKCSLQNMPKKGIYRKCKICGKMFYISKTFIKTAKYCSIECQHKGLDKNYYVKCKECGKQYKTTPSQVKHRGSSFCSMICFKKYRKTKYYKNNKMKKTTNGKLKKAFWKIFSEYIRQRDSVNGYGKCISCGRQDYWRNMDAGHYIPKTAGLSLYFDERNVNIQCTYCNRWMHGNLSQYALALIEKYGENILKDLDSERHKFKKISVIEYQKLIEEYKTKIDNFPK
jgi:hypothetical protein